MGRGRGEEAGSSFTDNFGTGDRPRRISVEHLIAAVGFLEPESFGFLFRQRLQAQEDPLGQPSPVLRVQLEDLRFQV